MRKKYNYGFYEDLGKAREGTNTVARIVYEKIMEVYDVCSIVDFGCGIGTWLSTFKQINQQGIILGIDGDWISDDQLLIDKTCFLRANLNQEIKLEKKYDLAQSLEVAEHLPKSRAYSFVKDLTDASDLVLFSAAIPGQGGIEHVNEQWLSYWVEIFRGYDYELFDVIRTQLWNRDDIKELHYKQNIVLFARKGTKSYDACSRIRMGEPICDIVHPDIYMDQISFKQTRVYKIALKISRVLSGMRI